MFESDITFSIECFGSVILNLYEIINKLIEFSINTFNKILIFLNLYNKINKLNN